jgi:hypothetical protein
MTKKVTTSWKHKRCNTWATKIKITTTRRVVSNCSKKGGKEKGWSTWGSWVGGSRATISTRDVRWKPPRSKSQWLGGSLTTIAKKEKEDDDQHEDCD